MGTLMACGASTELDDFTGSDGGPVDFGILDGSMRPGPDTVVGAFNGRSNTGGNWPRPFSCSDTFAAGIGHPYAAERFANETRFDLRVTVLVDWDFDGFLHVYRRFNPDRPLDTCIDANDDFMSTSQSQVTGIPLPAGESIDIVLSSFSEGAVGNYSAFVINE